MADLKEYTFTINGVETTLQLNDDDAKKYQDAYGDPSPADGTGDLLKQDAKPANKARSASDKSGGN